MAISTKERGAISIVRFDVGDLTGSPREKERQVYAFIAAAGWKDGLLLVSCSITPGIAEVMYQDCNPFGDYEDGHIFRLDNGAECVLVKDARYRPHDFAVRPHYFSFSLLPPRLSPSDITAIMKSRGHKISSVYLHYLDPERTVKNGNGFSFGKLAGGLQAGTVVSFSVSVGGKSDESFRVTVMHARGDKRRGTQPTTAERK